MVGDRSEPGNLGVFALERRRIGRAIRSRRRLVFPGCSAEKNLAGRGAKNYRRGKSEVAKRRAECKPQMKRSEMRGPRRASEGRARSKLRKRNFKPKTPRTEFLKFQNLLINVEFSSCIIRRRDNIIRSSCNACSIQNAFALRTAPRPAHFGALRPLHLRLAYGSALSRRRFLLGESVKRPTGATKPSSRGSADPEPRGRGRPTGATQPAARGSADRPPATSRALDGLRKIFKLLKTENF